MYKRAANLVGPNLGTEATSHSASSGPVKLEDLQRILNNIGPAGNIYCELMFTHSWLSVSLEPDPFWFLILYFADSIGDPDGGIVCFAISYSPCYLLDYKHSVCKISDAMTFKVEGLT